MAPTKDAPKQTLAVNDPEAGYLAPDLSFQDGTGTLPDEEKEWHEGRDEAREDEAERIAEAEDKVAKARQAEAEKAEKQQETAPKTTTTAKTST